MAEISFGGVGKAYGSVNVIQNLDLKIADGEFVVFVGPSGCGKSTALRMVAGLETVTSGELRIGDRVVNDLQPRDRDVAIVMQSYALYPHKTVRENIEFALKVRKTPKAEMNRLVDEAATILELGPYLDRRPKALSGGQRQRVALGRALVRRPSAFLFDEPLSNLDAELRVTMRSEILKLHKQFPATTIYVTHDQTEAMTMGDRIAVFAPLHLADGQNLMQCDTPMTLYREPANVFVAQFIGSPKMNILRMDIDKANGNLVSADQSLPIPPEWVGRIGSRKEVLVGLRPEQLYVGASARPGALTGTVDTVERLGDDAIVHLSLAGKRFVVRTGREDRVPAVDEALSVVPVAGAVHMFDMDTKRRL